MTQFIFVRHGESEANFAGFVNDDPLRPVALTARGQAQAAEVAEVLRDTPFSRAYASEFPRAQQTLAPILAYQACDALVDARINERKSGLDGQPCAAFDRWVDADPATPLPCGESFVEQMARVRAFMDEVAALDPDATVLAVSHENPILAALAVAGMPAAQAARGRVANCARVEIQWPLSV